MHAITRLPWRLLVCIAALPSALIHLLHAQPDLIVTSITWEPTTVVEGQTVHFSATIANIGATPTPDGVIHGVSFWIEGVPVSWSDTHVSSIAPGEFVVLTSNGGPAGTDQWLAIAGDFSVMACVDDINRLPDESDETNNQFTTIITVQSGETSAYDLVITDITWTTDPRPLERGEWMVFSARVQNQGNAPTPDGVVHGISFWVDGRPISWNDVWTSSLAPGEAVWLTGITGVEHPQSNFWVAEAGDHEVVAYIDDINRLPDEAHENNNAFGESLHILTDIMLAVAPVSPATEIVAGDAIHFLALVEPHSSATATHFSGVNVDFYLDGEYLCTTSRTYPAGADQPPLEVDSRFRFYLFPDPTLMPTQGIWIATPGVHRIEARINDPALPSSASFEFSVVDAPSVEAASAEAAELGAPDLVVDRVFFEPLDAREGDEIIFCATIRNAGNAPSPVGMIHGVSFWVDGQAVSWSDGFTESLAPNQSVTLKADGGPFGTPAWTAVAGEHTVEACVDDVNRLPDELDEGNNSTFAALNIS